MMVHIFQNNTKIILVILFFPVVSWFLTGCQAHRPSETSSYPQTTSTPDPAQKSTEAAAALKVLQGPAAVPKNINLRWIADTGTGTIKLALNPENQGLYYLRPTEGIFQVGLDGLGGSEKVVAIEEITPAGFLAGMKFGPDGRLYVVANLRPSTEFTQAAVFRGKSDQSGGFTWETLATTEPYPASNTNFDHLFNEIAISPDNQWLYLNSGSRTDHGEIQDNNGSFPDSREEPITSAILRIPADASSFLIPNNEAALIQQNILYADGLRNAYDLEFAPNGDLFAVDNGPDADFPDELNWIREGAHYGFPWRFGDWDNPQQFPDYDPRKDKRLSDDFVAVQQNTYQNDPGFPPVPGIFTDPIVNLGPEGVKYRDDQGKEHDAAEDGEGLRTFTPHRSPLGLVFINHSNLPQYLLPEIDGLSLFVLSWGAAGGRLSDKGQDLLHMFLVKDGDQYSAVTQKIALGFKRPIDAVMIENRLYVLEWDAEGTIWEFSFEITE